MRPASRQLAMREVLRFVADTLEDWETADEIENGGCAGRLEITNTRAEALRTLAKELRERSRQAASEGVGSR